ncbi:Uncharacterised protein [Proteus mirabilis]|uniref:Uncharacterized protein n=1 Tax=Proteus mirabilis TaxID=584 RepID=A0A2X2C978_PROMI|nr:Uncharacterised protein [Proteus mirabilis]
MKIKFDFNKLIYVAMNVAIVMSFLLWHYEEYRWLD